ncbi:hypothetical protein [Blastococcus mobilis]|uniref:hypothetical protein n=1 Tax=Blastococcus mobilis TaxID=1938746 RepID=UPI001130981C|nr:hypothetical protein [Blastococcus mobilis]
MRAAAFGPLLPLTASVPRARGALGRGTAGTVSAVTLRTTVLPLRTVTRGTVTLRTTVLPLGPVPVRAAAFGPLLPLTASVPRARGALGRGTAGTVSAVTLRTTVLPLRTVTRGTVTLRTTVLPLRPITGGPTTARSTGACGATASRTVTLRTTVLPLRTVTRGTVTLRTTVLPLRPITGRAAGLWSALLPGRLFVTRGISATAARCPTAGSADGAP